MNGDNQRYPPGLDITRIHVAILRLYEAAIRAGERLEAEEAARKEQEAKPNANQIGSDEATNSGKQTNRLTREDER